MRALVAVIVAALLVCGWSGGRAFADDPLTIQNAVGNTGNTNANAAQGTRGNVNQNTNQNANLNRNFNAASQGQGQSVGVGSITIGGSGDPNGDPNGYSGQNSVSFASPAQSINFGNSKVINFSPLGLPGIMGPPGNFTQPYKPDVFVNGAGPVRPSRMTLEQAKDCKGGWRYKNRYVGSDRGTAAAISLVYAAWDKIEMTNDISKYVGIASVEGSDKPWLPAVCEAAYHAMEHGANFGVIEFIIRPKNMMAGLGFGSSGGASGTPSVTTTSPYALAGTLGFGLGWSSQKVQGEVMIQLTGLKVDQAAGAPPSPSEAVGKAPAAPSQGAAASSASPATTPPAVTPTPPGLPPEGKIVVPNGGGPVRLPPPVPTTPPGEQQPGGQGQPGNLDMHLELVPSEQGCSAPNCSAASYLKSGAPGAGTR